MEPILQADSIGKTFRDRRVLSSACVSAAPGEVVGLLGRTGEGKSTLVRICAGQSRSDSGWVKYKGQICDPPRLSTMASSGVYYLPESGSLARSLTLQGHFDLFRDRFRLGSADELVDDFDLQGLLGASPDSLSTGERRRAEMALVFYRQPECLLADELFRDLDPITAERVGRVLRILAQNGCAVIVTGHEVRAMAPCLTSIVWLTSGTTYALGRPELAWKNEYFRREYLGPAE